MPNDPVYNAIRRGTRNDYYRERRLALYATPLGRADNLARRYKNDDRKRGFDISDNITAEWMVDNIFTKKCVYCGEDDWKKLGADRIDNDKPHTPDNVVCACGKCNVKKGGRRNSRRR